MAGEMVGIGLLGPPFLLGDGATGLDAGGCPAKAMTGAYPGIDEKEAAATGAAPGRSTVMLFHHLSRARWLASPGTVSAAKGPCDTTRRVVFSAEEIRPNGAWQVQAPVSRKSVAG